jgi:hypothetical protein
MFKNSTVVVGVCTGNIDISGIGDDDSRCYLIKDRGFFTQSVRHGLSALSSCIKSVCRSLPLFTFGVLVGKSSCRSPSRDSLCFMPAKLGVASRVYLGNLEDMYYCILDSK